MKVLIVSDTHGKHDYLNQVIDKVSPIDLLIHLGDFEGGEEYIKAIAPCPTEFVSGNNDFFNGLPKEKIIQLGKYSILLTHGHRFGVRLGTKVLKEIAQHNYVDIVMFGHTHIPMIDMKESIWAVCPGSISLPRQDGRVPSYIIMEIDTKGEAHFTIKYIK